MRKTVMLLGMMLLLVFMLAGAALAVTKTCSSVPCLGTDKRDMLHERAGTVRDRIYGLGERDILDANNYGLDRDVLRGGRERDKLLADDGDGRDVLRGGRGHDRCYADRGDLTMQCEVVVRSS